MKSQASAPTTPGRAPPRRRARRRPVFPLTPEQVRARCTGLGLDPLCAGEVLALMELMELRGCCILGLHQSTGVARSMISGILSLRKFPTTPLRLRLIRALGVDAVEFEALAVFCAEA